MPRDPFDTLLGARRGSRRVLPNAYTGPTTPAFFWGYDDELRVSGEISGRHQHLLAPDGRCSLLLRSSEEAETLVLATRRPEEEWLFQIIDGASLTHQLFDRKDYANLESLWAACGLGQGHVAREGATESTSYLKVEAPVGSSLVSLKTS